MSEIHPIAGVTPGTEVLSRDVPPSASPDPAFSRVMADAMNLGETPDASPLPATEVYNSHNLLNGQFPPPDSGAGYTFTAVSLLGEQAA